MQSTGGSIFTCPDAYHWANTGPFQAWRPTTHFQWHLDPLTHDMRVADYRPQHYTYETRFSSKPGGWTYDYQDTVERVQFYAWKSGQNNGQLAALIDNPSVDRINLCFPNPDDQAAYIRAFRGKPRTGKVRVLPYYVIAKK